MRDVGGRKKGDFQYEEMMRMNMIGMDSFKFIQYKKMIKKSLLRSILKSGRSRNIKWIVDSFISPTFYSMYFASLLDFNPFLSSKLNNARAKGNSETTDASMSPPANINQVRSFSRRHLKKERNLENVFESLRDVNPEILEKDIRFRSWIRYHYLDHIHGEKLRIVEQAKVDQVLLHNSKLPTIDKLLESFPELREWKREPNGSKGPNSNFKKFSDVVIVDDESIRRYLIEKYKKENNGFARKENGWTLETVLESIGCCVIGSGRWNIWCEKNQVYDFLTDEYVTSLSEFISNSKVVQGRKARIVEVGAGNGRLSYYLRLKLDPNKFEVISTDSGAWNLKKGSKISFDENVQSMDYVKALHEFNPDIIISSWMPLGYDWTNDFRQRANTRMYILIGETDYGCCGDPFRTWGVSIDNFLQSVPSYIDLNERLRLLQSTYFGGRKRTLDIFDYLGNKSAYAPVNKMERSFITPKVDKPLYEKDGFIRQNVKTASLLQFSRYDREQYASCSKTVAFIRA